MTRYSVVNNETGEVVLETDSAHLQRANDLLKANKRPYGYVKPSTFKRQTIGQACESWWHSAKEGGMTVLAFGGLVLVLAVLVG